MKVAVIGAGTAGILTAAQLLSHLPDTWTVYLVYNPNIPILGIGEATNTGAPANLWWGTGFNLLDHGSELDATIKLGTKFQNWRADDFYLPLPAPAYAFHFNNFKLKDFSLPRFKEKWKERFQLLEGTITGIGQDSLEAVLVVNDVNYSFDYVIDCGGYPKDYSDYDIVDTIPVNHCLVNIKNEPGTWNYTISRAHKNGWMFQIPLTTRQGRGYLYNDTITSKEEALEDMSEILNIPLNDLNVKEFSWKTFKAKEFFTGRIIKNGNRALFYEPMEALAGWFYERINTAFFSVAVTKQLTEAQANIMLSELAEDFELYICFMYQGGSKFDSKFWDITKEKTSNRIKNSEKFQKYLQVLDNAVPQQYHHPCPIMPMPYHVWHFLDKKLNYNYFKRNKNGN